MTETEKIVYNTFLRVSRSQRNKPYRLRKDFSKFEDSPDYPFVKKLANFFRKFPHIAIDTFFSAPYHVYDDTSEFYDIKFYTTPRATKLYGI